jgi:hypothetical protein
MGHIHETASRNDVRDCLEAHPKAGYFLEQKQIHMMLTGTYKEEYGDGSKGWHIERGAPVKPLGGRILMLKTERVRSGDSDKLIKSIDSIRFI